jgi:hypothetical protein
VEPQLIMLVVVVVVDTLDIAAAHLLQTLTLPVD